MCVTLFTVETAGGVVVGDGDRGSGGDVVGDREREVVQVFVVR